MTMIGCAEVVSVNTSYSRYYNLIWFSFSPHHVLMYYTSWTLRSSYDQQYIQHRYTSLSLCFTIYTIPLLFLKTLPQLQPKLQLKVVTISKYFKTTKQLNNTKSYNILYAQASKDDNNTRDIVKIKETFPNLQANKIENIQKS